MLRRFLFEQFLVLFDFGVVFGVAAASGVRVRVPPLHTRNTPRSSRGAVAQRGLLCVDSHLETVPRARRSCIALRLTESWQTG